MTFEFDVSDRNSDNNILKISLLEILIFIMENCEVDRTAER